MLDCMAAQGSDTVAVYELSDADLDAVAAGRHTHVAFSGSMTSPGHFSVGDVAIAVQVNSQVNVAVLSYDLVQGGSQTNVNNAGSLAL